MPTDVHVEGQRLRAENVIVDCGDFESILDRCRHDGGNFAFKQNKIAHHHRAAVRRLECRPSAKRQRGFYSHTIEGDRKIGARKTIAMYIARHRGLSTKGVIDFLPVDFLRVCQSRNKHGAYCCQERYQTTHHNLLSWAYCPVMPVAAPHIRQIDDWDFANG